MSNSEAGDGRETYTRVYLRVWEKGEYYTPGYTSGFGRKGGNIHPGIPQGWEKGGIYTPRVYLRVRREGYIHPGYTSGLGGFERYTPGYTSGLGEVRDIHPGIPQG